MFIRSFLDLICAHKEPGILQTGVRDTRTRPDPRASTLFKISGFGFVDQILFYFTNKFSKEDCVFFLSRKTVMRKKNNTIPFKV